MATPFFSIITATYNAAASLPSLMDSLVGQVCRDFELIVQDGGSSDGTLHLVESYKDRLPSVVCKSEPDSGIYEAWNKAVSSARGEWLLFLGADDCLIERRTLSQAMGPLQAVPRECTLAAASLELRGAHSRRILKPVMEGFGSMFSVAPVPFPSLFIRRTVAMNNPFDINFQLSGDYDFLCRVWFNANPVELNFCAVGMTLGGVSADPRNWLKSDYEMFVAAHRHLPKRAPLPKKWGGIAKTCLVATVFKCLGLRHGAAVLDRIRMLRGLPPSWNEQIQPLLEE